MVYYPPFSTEVENIECNLEDGILSYQEINNQHENSTKCKYVCTKGCRQLF